MSESSNRLLAVLDWEDKNESELKYVKLFNLHCSAGKIMYTPIYFKRHIFSFSGPGVDSDKLIAQFNLFGFGFLYVNIQRKEYIDSMAIC